jgi:site-specific DNA recombinase
MLKRRFDPSKQYLVVLYLRMSSDLQNPRSPGQQKETIEATIKRLGLPWTVVAVYVDAGVSGRYVAKRPQFQEMLRAIRSGRLKADLVLVDSFERFGRSEDVGFIRQELERHYGILVLTADSQFADPTSTAGQVLVAFETIRATDANRLKAHDVLRGKRDAAKQKHWPGGPVPFGFRLHSILIDHNGRQEVDYSILLPDPVTAWIIQLLFRKAVETGMGCTRLARWLNDCQDIPADYKPFLDQTVNFWLAQEIYKGELVWPKHATGVIDDRRVIEKNPDEEIIRVLEFCEPLVDPSVWQTVQEIRSVRVARAKIAREATDVVDKQIAPLVAGVALRYILSGLVVCDHCMLSMCANSSQSYTSKSTGEVRDYVYYYCPRASSGVCPNKKRVPEKWLRETVVNLIRDRLFRTDL